MDYEEEQSAELDTLASIYCDDMEILSAEAPRRVRLTVRSADDDGEERQVWCAMVFEPPLKYPDEPPLLLLEETQNLDDEDQQRLVDHLMSMAEENLGMVMIFTLVAAAQEWLDNKSDELKKVKEEGALKKLRAEEEAEMKRFEGTRVSVESFLAWKTNFEIETGIVLRREKDLKDSRKLTGKELFLRDTTLNESDLKFLDDGDAVKVDESLFQDVDDLDLSEEDDDCDNYKD
ncbi:RWD domain-containing protein 1 isoform X2 [Arctopsyche grandis]|uniref:RWD domain-containing protein 1 isoform X2 n=1 Tax=Arctopsyche grandis TaxID=121162 RepID=UPI00406D74D5